MTFRKISQVIEQEDYGFEIYRAVLRGRRRCPASAGYKEEAPTGADGPKANILDFADAQKKKKGKLARATALAAFSLILPSCENVQPNGLCVLNCEVASSVTQVTGNSAPITTGGVAETLGAPSIKGE